MIFLVAGHNRAGTYLTLHKKDPGAVPPYSSDTVNPPLYNEHHEAEKLVTEAVNIFKKEKKYPVSICPFSYNLKGKIQWINSKSQSKNDLVVEVHLNASTDEKASGVEVWYYGGSKQSKTYAEKMVDALSKILQLPNRGAIPDTQNRHGRLAIIRDTEPWAFLLEMGFIGNKEDMKKMRTYGAQGIVNAVNSFY